MQKVGLTFGVAGGVLLSAFVVLELILWQKGVLQIDLAAIWGYTTMLVAMSAIFFGIKSYRDKQLKGVIRFWKGAQLGLLISLVAAVMYAATWEVYRASQPQNYSQFLSECQRVEIDKVRDGGGTQEEVDAKTQEMADFMVLYENPLTRFGFTILEALPVGILVSLFSAALLRRREVAPQ